MTQEERIQQLEWQVTVLQQALGNFAVQMKHPPPAEDPAVRLWFARAGSGLPTFGVDRDDDGPPAPPLPPELSLPMQLYDDAAKRRN